jgi:hypothetical protein
MRLLPALLPLLLIACGQPAVLRQGPGAASMERAEGVPLPRLVEPTGQGPITLADPTDDDPQAFRGMRRPATAR